MWGQAPRTGLLRTIRMTLDSLNHSWNSVIVTYDFERQVEAVQGAGKRLQRIEARRAFRSVLPYLLLTTVLAGLCSLLMYRKRLFPTREDRLLQAFYRRVERDCGLRVERGRVGLFELADLTANPAVREFADIYAGAVYRDRPLGKDDHARLLTIVATGFKSIGS
jgi:hypothetical protein